MRRTAGLPDLSVFSHVTKNARTPHLAKGPSRRLLRGSLAVPFRIMLNASSMGFPEGLKMGRATLILALVFVLGVVACGTNANNPAAQRGLLRGTSGPRVTPDGKHFREAGPTSPNGSPVRPILK